jgi:hypothetical protein
LTVGIRTLRQALGSAVPAAEASAADRPAPKLGEYRELIDEWLAADVLAPAQAAAHGQTDLAATRVSPVLRSSTSRRPLGGGANTLSFTVNVDACLAAPRQMAGGRHAGH